MKICPRCLKSLYKNTTDHDCVPSPEWKVMEQRLIDLDAEMEEMCTKEKEVFARTRMNLNKHKAIIITARAALQKIVDSGVLSMLTDDIQEEIWATCDLIDKGATAVDISSPSLGIDYEIAYADGYVAGVNNVPYDSSQTMESEVVGYLDGYLDGKKKVPPKYQI